jgi:mono/diheme cytochrome c family protein
MTAWNERIRTAIHTIGIAIAGTYDDARRGLLPARKNTQSELNSNLITERNAMKSIRTLAASVSIIGLAIALFVFAIPAAHADTAATYKAKCAPCHALDGTPTQAGKVMGAHDLRTEDVQKMSDADLTTIIAKGKNKMKAYEKELKPEEIKALVAFVRTMKK